MSETSIEWTHYTFNPWWGCVRVSPGCEHCYAEAFAHRLGLEVWGPTAPRRFFGTKHWSEPFKWARRRRAGDARHLVFCASMADVFEACPDPEHQDPARCLCAERGNLWALIEATRELTWQLLTKRPENINAMVPAPWLSRGWPANVWMLVTAEDQQRADERIPALLKTGARVKGVSYEPALGPVDFRLGGMSLPEYAPHRPLPRLDWLIVGGESGPRARPFDVAWARSAVRQCREDGVPVFFKQAGARIAGDPEGFNVCRWHMADGRVFIPPMIGPRIGLRPADAVSFGLGSPKGGDPAEWPEDLRVREFPAAPSTAALPAYCPAGHRVVASTGECDTMRETSRGVFEHVTGPCPGPDPRGGDQ